MEMNDNERRLETLEQALKLLREARDLIRMASFGTKYQRDAEICILPDLNQDQYIKEWMQGLIHEVGRIHYDQVCAYISELSDQYLSDDYQPEKRKEGSHAK